MKIPPKEDKKSIEQVCEWIGWRKDGTSRDILYRKTKGEEIVEERVLAKNQYHLVALERIRWEAAQRILR